jgi:hypothetical protein
MTFFSYQSKSITFLVLRTPNCTTMLLPEFHPVEAIRTSLSTSGGNTSENHGGG